MRRLNPAALLTALLALLFLVLYLLFPLTGDDYGYMGAFRTVDGFDGPWPLERLWRWFPFHWLHSNGRLANLFAMLSLTFLPKWLTALVMGAATWGMMALVLRLGDAWRGRVLAACAALAYIAVAYPWWDLMFTVDFNFNYPVAACAGLLFVYLWQRYPSVKGKSGRGLVLAFSVVAGGFHESMGAPMLVAAIWLLYWNRGLAKWPVAAFAAGVAMAFCSPGIWGRATADRVADAPMWELVACSAPLTLLAAALFGGLLCWGRWRAWMKVAVRGWWGFWLAASAGSLLFCAVGGIIGRSGWFSQTFALVALLLWSRSLKLAPPDRPRRSAVYRGLCWVLAVAALFFAAAPIPAVARMAAAERQARQALAASDDGVVVADLPKESGQPWYTLRRVRTLDADDYYLHQVIADYYKKPRFLILPSRRDTLSSLPEGAEPIEAGTYGAPPSERFMAMDADGARTVYLLLPGEGGYVAVPRERDPGDR